VSRKGKHKIRLNDPAAILTAFLADIGKVSDGPKTPQSCGKSLAAVLKGGLSFCNKPKEPCPQEEGLTERKRARAHPIVEFSDAQPDGCDFSQCLAPADPDDELRFGALIRDAPHPHESVTLVPPSCSLMGKDSPVKFLSAVEPTCSSDSDRSKELRKVEKRVSIPSDQELSRRPSHHEQLLCGSDGIFVVEHPAKPQSPRATPHDVGSLPGEAAGHVNPELHQLSTMSAEDDVLVASQPLHALQCGKDGEVLGSFYSQMELTSVADRPSRFLRAHRHSAEDGSRATLPSQAARRVKFNRLTILDEVTGESLSEAGGQVWIASQPTVVQKPILRKIVPQATTVATTAPRLPRGSKKAVQKRARFDAVMDPFGENINSTAQKVQRVEHHFDSPQSPILDPSNPLTRILGWNQDAVPPISVPEQLCHLLRQHQWAGLNFMWRRLILDEDPLKCLGDRLKVHSRKGVTPAAAASRLAELISPKRRIADMLEASGDAAKGLGNEDGSPVQVEAERAPIPRGCVLAHAMGLGKTMTTVAFLFCAWRLLDRQHGEKGTMPRALRCIVVVPKPVAFHWVREINRWAEVCCEEPITVFFLSGETKTDKLALLREWEQSISRSVLIIPHGLFGSIMNVAGAETSAPSKRRGHPRSAAKVKIRECFWGEETIPDDEENEGDVGESVRQRTRCASYRQCRDIIASSTTLLVVDEAHKMHSSHSKLFQATQRLPARIMRVALSGTPIVNPHSPSQNLITLLQFVYPQLRTWRDLSPDTLDALSRVFIHQRGLETIRQELPSIVENTVRVAFSETQQKMFTELICCSAEKGRVPRRRILDTVSRTIMISNHTELVADWLRSRGVDEHTRMEDIASIGAEKRSVLWAMPSLQIPCAFDVDDDGPMASLKHNTKMCCLLHLLRIALASREKVIVFSHSVKTLFLMGFMMTQLGLSDVEDFAMLDGRVPCHVRDRIVERFNDPDSSLAVMLLSFASCSVGINLTGAQRVILYDPSWRQTSEAQAIFRAVRFDQQHSVVYVNRLVSDNLVETKLSCLIGSDGCDSTSVVDNVTAAELIESVGKQVSAPVASIATPATEPTDRALQLLHREMKNIVVEILGTRSAVV
jgi:hypothetical protein